MMHIVRRLVGSSWTWLIAAAVLAVYTLLAPTLAQRLGSGDPRPVGTAEDVEALASRDDVNVLFILIDTLRADRLGAYGYERPTSPALDRLADRGVRFSRHLAQSSWTKCSMASLWSGLFPNRSGVTRFDQVLSEEAELPAEILADAGFRTAGIFRNGWLMGYFGFGQGFETYVRPIPEPVRPGVRAENPTINVGGSDLDVTTAANEFLRVHGHQRWFLYLHLMDVHQYLYSEDTAVFGTSYSDIYDNSILWTNRVLEPFFEELARGGHLENTIIVVTSDHGEAFGERGFEGHARHVFRETTEVPFILSFPFRFEQPVVISQRTRGVDVWPTVLDLLGLPTPGPGDGRSLRPEILAGVRRQTDPRPDDELVAYAHLDQNWGRANQPQNTTLAVVDDDLRYVSYRDAEGEIQQELLYDASSDPLEQTNVADRTPEDLEKMRALAEAYLANDAVPFEPNERLELDELQLNQLRALGYQVP
jgi:arylsulfatase A-like enzyme